MSPGADADTVILVDLSGYIFRAFHALPPLTAPDGFPTGALYGLANMLLRLVQEYPEARIVAVQDSPGPSWRNDVHPAYKAQRPPPPEDLVRQFDEVSPLVDAFGIPRLQVAGHEADDLIAEAAVGFRDDGLRVVIASSDKDLLQLVGERVVMWDAMRDKTFDAAAVVEKWGVPPARIPDLFALMGDSSDNVPGVRGIGPKRANQLLAEFDTLDGLLASLDGLPDQAWARNLREGVDDARLSYRLVRLPSAYPSGLVWREAVRREPDWAELDALCSRFGFDSLRGKLRKAAGRNAGGPDRHRPAAAGTLPGFENEIADAADRSWLDARRLEAMLDPAAIAAFVAGGHPIALDTETTSLTTRRAELVGLSLAADADAAVYVPLGHRDGVNADKAAVLDALRTWAEDPAQPKWGQNLKYDAQVLRRAGIGLRGIAGDSMIASQLLDPDVRGHGLDALAERELGHTTIGFKDVATTGDFRDVPASEAVRYAGEDAVVAWALCERLHRRLDETGMTELYRTIEMPVVGVLAEMEWHGVRLDVPRMEGLRQELKRGLTSLEARIMKRIERPINIQSPKQVGHYLFEVLGLPTKGVPKTKTGGWSTDADVLEALRDAHPVVGEILEHRTLAKLLATYADGLLAAVLPETGRIHPSFHQLGASTGRLSCSDPNLQNIPIRDEWGRRIRTCFVPDDGFVFVGADYSQIELRILAHVSGDPGLTSAFEAGLDVHTATAAELFGIAAADVAADQRRAAKTINFGLMYGMGAQRLGATLGIPTAEAAEWIKRYFERFPGIAAFRQHAVDEARESGWVATMFGRRRRLPEPGSGARRDPSWIERIAVNTPIQGAAADLIKLAMIEVHRRLAAEHPRARLILQVHDELLVEVPAAEAESVRRLMHDAMEGAATLRVPLLVESGIGQNWAEAH